MATKGFPAFKTSVKLCPGQAELWFKVYAVYEHLVFTYAHPLYLKQPILII